MHPYVTIDTLDNEYHVVSSCAVLSAGVGSSHGDDGGNGAGHTHVLVILGTAFGVMFATLTTLMFTSMRLHHRDNTKTRELIAQASNDNRKLIKQATKKLTADFDKQTSVTQGKLDNVVTSLSDARERLARIEGHLGIELPSKTEPESNGDNSEAA